MAHYIPGYIVFSTVKNLNGVLGLQVLVQSHRTPEHVDQRIENFIHEMQVLHCLFQLVKIPLTFFPIFLTVCSQFYFY